MTLQANGLRADRGKWKNLMATKYETKESGKSSGN